VAFSAVSTNFTTPPVSVKVAFPFGELPMAEEILVYAVFPAAIIMAP
jgi:hypothetical protein